MTTAIETRDPSPVRELDDNARSLLFTDARTANAFAESPVSDDELRRIWDLAKWAPTAVNAQPLRVTFVQSTDARSRLVDHMNEGNKERVSRAPAVALLAYDSAFHEHFSTISPSHAHLEPVLDSNDQMRLDMAMANANMQAGYFILAARALGLAAGPMGGFDKDGMDRAFFADGRFRSLLVVNLGYPTADSYRPRQPRLTGESVLTFT